MIGKVIAAYVRVSKEDQDEQRQVKRIEDWAAENGVSISLWFIDNEGRNPRDMAKYRKEFQRLFTAVRTGQIDVIVVAEQDRFGVAHWAEFGHYVNELLEYGVTLWSATEGELSNMDNDVTAITNALGVQKSRSEQKKIADRNLSQKINRAKNGEYPGGYPPFGCDVVCFDKSGKELWRVHFDGGHHNRVKITGDEQVRYDGLNNFPAKDKDCVLRLRPTIAVERIETLQNIFRWYTEEQISPTQIATRLRDLEVSACFGTWDKQKIKEILRNPAAIGYPTFNKRGGSRFVEFVDGKIQPVTAKVKGRVRSQSDWIMPDEPEYDALVDEELFQVAQARLQAQSEKYGKKKKKSPRTARFWLRNLAVCWKCGREMRIRTQNGGAYFCATYGTYGKSNPTGCRCHAISKRVLEQIIDDYLEHSHGKIADLIRANETQDTSVFANLEGELIEKYKLLATCWERIEETASNNPDIRLERKRITVEFLESDQSDEDLKRFIRSKINLYQSCNQGHQRQVDVEMVRLEAERERLSNLLSRLPETATRTIQNTAEDLEQTELLIQEAEARRKNVAGEMWDCLAELRQRHDVLDRVRTVVSDDAGYRRKAELASQVIEQVVIEYDERNEKAANRPKSVPIKIEVIPKLGDSYIFCLPDRSQPAPS